MFSVKPIVLLLVLIANCLGYDDSSNDLDGVDVDEKVVSTDRLYDSIPQSSFGEGNSVYYTKGLPKNFDAREQWPYCPSIGEAHTQGADRPVLSAQHILSCCYLCGYGCKGGELEESWDFFRRHGFVSGGQYNSSQGCQPYSVPPCSIVYYPGATYANMCPLSLGPYLAKTPKCETQCYNPTYNKSYRSDFYKGNHYKVSPYMAMKEIYEHGPITTTFYMYRDLVPYKYGIYQYSEEVNPSFFTTQSVKIIGWGEEYDKPYWLAVNSFGPQWGNKGAFKISRGDDGCAFQDHMIAGLPL